MYSSFLNEVKLCLPLEGREVLLYFGGCQTQDNSGQSSPQTRFLKNKIIFCKKYFLSSMYNDIFILLYEWLRTSVTSCLLSLFIVIGLTESNQCLWAWQRQKKGSNYEGKAGRDYVVFGNCQSAKGLLFLPEVGRTLPL